MILVTMESSPLAITVNTESTMFEKENPLISLSIVKSSSVSLYTISSPTVNLKQNPSFFFFKISDRGFIFNHWKSDLYLQIPTSEKYIEKLQVTIDDNDNSNIIVEFKIEQKKKRSNIEIRNSATENNIPPTLLRDSSYRRTNRYCSRTSNCTPPRGKIRNRRAAVEPWLDSRRWSPISRTRGGKSSSSRQPWSAWIRPGMYGRRDVFPLTNPCLVQTSLSDSVASYAKNDNFTGPAPRAWLTGFLCGIQYTSWELLWPRGWWIEG